MDPNSLAKLKIEPEKRAKMDVKSRQKKKWLFITVGAALFVSLFIYRYFYHPLPVEVKPLETQELGLPPVLLTAGGYLIADPQIVVSARAAGKIERIFVKEGAAVKSGELLAALEATDVKAQYEETRSAYETAKRQLARMQALYKDDVISRRELELNRDEFERQKARYEGAKFNYEETQVRAPIDGSVIEIIREAGEFLSPGLTPEGDPGSGVLKLGNLREMKVELDINESDIGKITLNTPVLIFPDSMPNVTLRGYVLEMSPKADRQKSVVPIKVKLEQTDVALKPEMSARVLFLEEEMKGEVERVLLVPEDAVRGSEKHPFVYLFKDERARKQPVVLGEKVEKTWKVKSGLAAGDALIVDPPLGIRDGKRVKVEGE